MLLLVPPNVKTPALRVKAPPVPVSDPKKLWEFPWATVSEPAPRGIELFASPDSVLMPMVCPLILSVPLVRVTLEPEPNALPDPAMSVAFVTVVGPV